MNRVKSSAILNLALAFSNAATTLAGLWKTSVLLRYVDIFVGKVVITDFHLHLHLPLYKHALSTRLMCSGRSAFLQDVISSIVVGGTSACFSAHFLSAHFYQSFSQILFYKISDSITFYQRIFISVCLSAYFYQRIFLNLDYPPTSLFINAFLSALFHIGFTWCITLMYNYDSLIQHFVLINPFLKISLILWFIVWFTIWFIYYNIDIIFTC